MKGYVTMKAIGNYGRFANGAYQVAGIIGIARRNELTPVFPLWRNTWHRDAFGSEEDIDIYKHLVNPLPLIPDGIEFQDRVIDWGYHDVELPAGNWNLSGHFQSTKYFKHCLDEVRWQLRMKGEPEQNDYCAVHWRAGDYTCEQGYHPRMTMDYYKPAMAMFPTGQKFLVFSDDIESAKKMFGNAAEYSEGKDYLTDFKLLKNCRHFIISNSSFSALAAVLGEAEDKQVVAPRPWFGAAYTNITGEDIYNFNWTVINWQNEREAAA